MISMGIDIASCTGLALVGDGEDRGKTLEIAKSKGFSRLHLIAQNVEQTLQVWQPDIVVVERYAYCRNIGSFITLVELGTTIRQVLWDLKLPWYEVPPTTLKKWVTGHGAAKKDQMAKYVEMRWGHKSPSHDVVDAFALAQMGLLGPDKILEIKGVYLGTQ